MCRSRSSVGYELEGGFSTPYGFCREAAIECRQMTPMGNRQCQKIAVGNLPRGQDLLGVDMLSADQAYVVGPEHVAWQCPQLGNDGRDDSRRSRRAGIFWMAGDPNDAVLGQRASRPGLPALFNEPAVRGVMPDMGRINEGDEHIDVEQEGQSNSSRSALTVSSVTRV